MLNNSKNKYYIFRIRSQHYQDDNALLCMFTIENIKTLEIKDVTIMQLIGDMELLSEFSPQDILTIAYAAAQQNMWQEMEWREKNIPSAWN